MRCGEGHCAVAAPGCNSGPMDVAANDGNETLLLINQGAEAEARCIAKARKLGVCTPVLYSVDPVLHTLSLEYVEGVSVEDIFLQFGANGIIEERLDDISSQIGDAIAKLHDGGLVHGDLTTSNMLIKNDTSQLVLIDFGLSFTSTLPEDKAVDLHVLERALLSMHSSCGNVEVLEAMVVHVEQACPSEAARAKAYYDRMSRTPIAELITFLNLSKLGDFVKIMNLKLREGIH